jgi:hypothetical protein
MDMTETTTTIAAEAERERDHALPGKEHVTMCITWHAVTRMLRERRVVRDQRLRAISVRLPGRR